jgi:hypothetical protein
MVFFFPCLYFHEFDCGIPRGGVPYDNHYF